MYQLTVTEDDRTKQVRSTKYNYSFDKKTGFFARWGNTHGDDPTYSPRPEIADIEISTICSGVGRLEDGKEVKGSEAPCSFCYKTNTSSGTNMSFDTFKIIFDKLNKDKILTQIAFGIGDIDGNPDMFKIMKYTRDNGVIPNITINGWGLTDELADKLSAVCGAIAVSHYNDDICFNAVKKLTDRIGIKKNTLAQVNIHQLLSQETLLNCRKILDQTKSDERLTKLSCVVFLSLKQKGMRNTFTPVSNETDYKKLIDYALDNHINIGFDSCGANKFLNAVKDRPNYKDLEQVAEGCESTCFSIYVDVDGEIYPCSFCAGETGWEKGISLLDAKSMRDIWFSKRIKDFRNKSIACNRSCTMFNI